MRSVTVAPANGWTVTALLDRGAGHHQTLPAGDRGGTLWHPAAARVL